MELFKLMGKIAIDSEEAEQSLDSVSVKGALAQTKFGSVATKIGSAAKVAGKAVAAGMAAAGVAMVKIGKDAVESYAEYEQLVGGVETLFGESADKVLQYAQNAYKTAGLSANDYMETVTSFSASLLQSVGGDTAKAAEDANLALTDMSDNANKMGTSMDAIQNAYQGFAKQNYTMLDNLKLGYGGTKSEMERLLADAQKLSGQKYDVSSFDDIVQAIHVVQTEMGITGTTSEEASSTIQGSANAMKAAWENLLTGMADESQDLDALLENFIDSVVTFGDNLIPRIQEMLPRLVSAVSKLASALAANLPAILETLIPSLIEGAVNVVGAIIKQIPSLVASIVKGLVNGITAAIPSVKAAGKNLLMGLWNGISSVGDWIKKKVTGFGSSILGTLKSVFQEHSPSKATEKSGKNLVLGLSNGITKNSKKAKAIVKKFGEELLSTLNKRLSNYKVYHDMTLKQEMDFWNNSRKLFKKGTQDRIDADQKYYEAKEKYTEQLKDLEEEYLEAVAKADEKITDRASEILKQFKLFDSFEMDEQPTTQSLIDALNSQVTALYEWEYQMDALKSKIGESALYDAIEEMGVDSLAQVKAINSMTENELKTYVTLYNERSRQANKQAESELGEEVAADKLAAYEEYKKGVEEIGGTVKKKYSEMYETVKSTDKQIKSNVSSTFNSVKMKIKNSMDESVKSVQSAMKKINTATSATTVSTETKTTKTKVKAHASGGILTKPTIFGYTPNTYHLGGEAGDEAIAPIDTLLGYVKTAVASENSGLVAELRNIAEKLGETQTGGDTIIPVYIGGDKIDEIILSAKQRITNRSGGFANV